MEQAITKLFERYEHAFNTALAGDTDLDEVSSLYTDVFVSATPAGISTGTNDESLKRVMKAGFEHYRAIGTTRMAVHQLHVDPIDALHAIAFVDWIATYDRQGSTLNIPFTNAYFVRLQGDAPKVFGWVTGDEEAELRKHGIG
ncbi:MAG: nuclear transport factor 2 family protein [Pigmentiphaga sp.]|uniref:nuclear transport factor 2 family protein n=1 Tax=Pigmentiphaga sp. TaxID=1977564 RepID=UPI0029AC0FC6|nr:nuclear transport factor 2 family protein [Pigmentiphaga sp.]MDX3905835.1 nuclear transport factor 2 family protein [Pigmentiphaga sp.]